MSAATSFPVFTHSPWNKSFHPRRNKQLLQHTSFRSLPLPKLKLNCSRRLSLKLQATPDQAPKPSPSDDDDDKDSSSSRKLAAPTSGFLIVILGWLKSFSQWELKYLQDHTEVIIDVVWKNTLSIVFAEWKLPYTIGYIVFKTLIYPGLKLRGDDGKSVLRLPWHDDSKKEEVGGADTSSLPITRTTEDKFDVLASDINRSFKVKVKVVIEADDGDKEKEED